MKETPQILDHGITTTCGKCRHAASIDLFITTPIYGELPASDFQCPNCMTAIRVGKPLPDTVNEFGRVTTGNLEITEIEGVL